MKPLPKIYLGSTSPRRKELLKMAGFQVQVVPHGIDETYPKNLPIKKIPEFLADKKLQAITQKIQDQNKCILTADSIVLVHGEVIGKPKNILDAKKILKKLSNTKHEVITGVAIQWKGKKMVFKDTTTIYLKPLSDDMITYYINVYKPFDKAGSYGIQEWLGVVGVKKISGDFFNVTGLPIGRVYDKIVKMIEN